MRTQRPLAAAELFLFSLVTFLLTAPAYAAETDVIGGITVGPAAFPEVVQVRNDGSSCTGVIVGPRVIATAAHCVRNGSKATFTAGGKEYVAKMTRSDLYPREDHDLALGVVSEEIEGVRPASIGTVPAEGDRVAIVGYGCTQPGGGGGNDGKLRLGMTKVTSLEKYDVVTKLEEGGALCFGDSGAPLYGDSRGHVVLGLGSKGNIQNTSYFVRVDTAASQATFWKFIAENDAGICGLDLEC